MCFKICINYFLNKSLEYRINFCEKLRGRSEQSHIQNDNSIIDVSEKAVEKVFKKNNYNFDINLFKYFKKKTPISL